MWLLKFLVYAVVSFGCSKAYFNSSAFGTAFVFCILNAVATMKKEDFVAQRRMPKRIYAISIAVCLTGLALIIAGKNFLHRDALIMVGAILFAAAITGMIMDQIFRIPGYLEKLKQNKE